jgi:hypothetical protein
MTSNSANTARRPTLALTVFGLLLSLGTFHIYESSACAQKGSAEPDWYPIGYNFHTWTGEVIAFDNDQRTLTLQSKSGKNAETFVASIPNAPYQWRRDIRKSRVLDFPYDMKFPSQRYVYVGQGVAASIVPDGAPSEVRVPNPPASDVIDDFSQFKGRKIMVFYTERERDVNGQKVKYNDVWRVRVLDKK